MQEKFVKITGLVQEELKKLVENAVDNFVFYEIISGVMFNTNNIGGGGMGAGSLQQNIWINVIVTRNDGLTSFYKNSF